MESFHSIVYDHSSIHARFTDLDSKPVCFSKFRSISAHIDFNHYCLDYWFSSHSWLNHARFTNCHENNCLIECVHCGHVCYFCSFCFLHEFWCWIQYADSFGRDGFIIIVCQAWAHIRSSDHPSWTNGTLENVMVTERERQTDRHRLTDWLTDWLTWLTENVDFVCIHTVQIF